MVNKEILRQACLSKPNVVWIIIDSLRPDFLSSFGGNFEETFLDQIISKGIRFSNCFSVAPYTITSETAMFSGLNPAVSGINGWFKTTPFSLRKGVISITELFSDAGYYCGYYSPTPQRAYVPPFGFHEYHMLKNTKDFDLQAFKRRASSPYFLTLCFEDIHDDCCDMRGSYSKENYRKSLLKVSASIEEKVNELGGISNSFFILTSDHGVRTSDDVSSDRHIDEHVTGMYLTNKTLSTVWGMAYGEHIPSEVVSCDASIIDIPSTLADIFSFSNGFGQGSSKLDHIFGEALSFEQTIFFETGSMLESPWVSNRYGVKFKDFKYLIKKDRNDKVLCRELYNLKEDPDELYDISKQNPEVVFNLENVLLKKIGKEPIEPISVYSKNSGLHFDEIIKRRKLNLRVIINIFVKTSINFWLSKQIRYTCARYKYYLMRAWKA